MCHIFFSYASTDSERVMEACAALEHLNFRVWVAPRDITTGSPYSVAISQAIRSCLCSIVFITETSNKSTAVLKEVELSLRFTKPIVTVLLNADSKPSGGLAYHLASSQWIHWAEDPMAFAWEVRRYVQSIAPEAVARSAWDDSSRAISCISDSDPTTISPPDWSGLAFPIECKREDPQPPNARLPLTPGEEIGEYIITSCLGASDLSLTYLANRIGHPREQVIIREMFPRGLAFREAPYEPLKWKDVTPAKRKTIKAIREAHLREVTLSRNSSLSDLCMPQQTIRTRQTQFSIRKFIDGQSLKNIVETPDRSISATEARDLFALLLDQLSLLHAAGILHGDLKPANIIISKVDGPKIIDYEAHMRVGEPRPEDLPIIVSEGFTPPEGYGSSQRSRSICRESFDFFSLGATIYFCLTKSHPRLATIERDIDKLIRDDYIPWRLASAVGWCLAANLNERPQSTAELRAFLAPGDIRHTIVW